MTAKTGSGVAGSSREVQKMDIKIPKDGIVAIGEWRPTLDITGRRSFIAPARVDGGIEHRHKNGFGSVTLTRHDL